MNPTPVAPPAAPFRCPACGDSSVAAGTCARCDVPMVPAARVGDRLAVRSVTYALGVWRTLTFVVGLLGGMWLAVQMARALAPRMTAANARELGILAVAPCGMLAIVLAIVLAGGIARRVHAVREALAARVARWSAARVPAAAARDDTRVRLRGTVSVRRAVSTPAGHSCAAFELRTTAQDGADEQTVTGGGEFALDDGSGVPVRVMADQAVVVTGARTNGERVVPEGATVEVVGLARWTAASPDERVASLRGISPRALELTGSAERPLLIHVVQTASAVAPAPVRAAPAEAHVRVAAAVAPRESAAPSPGAAPLPRNARRND